MEDIKPPRRMSFRASFLNTLNILRKYDQYVANVSKDRMS